MSAPSASRRDRPVYAGRSGSGRRGAAGAGDVDGGAAAAAEAIKRPLAAQIALRNNRRLETAMRASRLPVVRDVARLLRYASTEDVGKSSLRQTDEP